jgi:uncharacterized protein YqeY
MGVETGLLRETINDALKQALKQLDKRRIATLRLISAAIKDRDIAARGADKQGVSDEEILEIMARMIKQRRDSITAFEDGGRLELAQQEQEEIDVITEFLPKQFDDDEIRAACETVVKEIEAAGLKDMGRTMAELKSRYTGQMDFSKASRLVREMLG